MGRIRDWLKGEGPIVPAPTAERGLWDWQNDFGGSFAPYVTTYGNEKAEPLGTDFADFAQGGFKADSVVFACQSLRLRVFSEVRFQFQWNGRGRPGDLFGNPDLRILEKPYPGGVTGDLLTRMLLDADLSGNAYHVRIGNELVRLRPDWVEIALEPRMVFDQMQGKDMVVGYKRVGYFYYEGGKLQNDKPSFFLASEVSHFAPTPDPTASYRGMSWLTPVVREIQADIQATKHKLKFFEHAATPNLAVSLPKEVTPAQYEAFVQKMTAAHSGVDNAYKTLYTAGGADVTVIGANLQQLDFKVTQGAGETRIAAAAGTHPVLVGLSEGLSGSSLNAGNFAAARRSTVDGTIRPLWRNAAGSLETIVTPPGGARLWYDARDVAYLREDEQDAAKIQSIRAISVKTLIDAGYEPDSVVKAVDSDDFTLLQHSGLYSVQLQAPGTTDAPADPATPAADPATAEGDTTP